MTYRDDPEIAKKYRSKRWQNTRKIKLLVNPFCERCSKEGIYNDAEIVHHKEYITDKNYQDDFVFYNIENLESLCRDCHNKEHFGEQEEYYFDKNGDLIKKDF